MAVAIWRQACEFGTHQLTRQFTMARVVANLRKAAQVAARAKALQPAFDGARRLMKAKNAAAAPAPKAKVVKAKVKGKKVALRVARADAQIKREKVALRVARATRHNDKQKQVSTPYALGARKGQKGVSGQTWSPSWGQLKTEAKPVGACFVFKVTALGKLVAQCRCRAP